MGELKPRGEAGGSGGSGQRSHSPSRSRSPSAAMEDAVPQNADEDAIDDDVVPRESRQQQRRDPGVLSNSRPAPGDLLKLLLLSNNDNVEEEPWSPLPSDSEKADDERSRSREKTRKRSPSQGSDAPQPKKMPRPKVRPPATVHGVADGSTLMVATPKSSAPRPSVGPTLMTAAAWKSACRKSRHSSRPIFRPRQEEWSREDRWRQQQTEAQDCLARLAGRCRFGNLAMQVLARHCARLGPVAAGGLEEAVKGAVAMAVDQDMVDKVEIWDFLDEQQGRTAFNAVKLAANVYGHKGRTPQADAEVRWQLGLMDHSRQLGEEALEIPLGESPPPPPHPPAEEGKGELMLLPISDVRFAHNNQSEHFMNCAKDCSILQLAVELVAGSTPIEAVPTFTVCWHAGQWYCRSGNRRLAAFVLASLFAPRRFDSVWVRVVATDPIFLNGRSSAKARPKLTTHLNGEDCQGRWLLIKETGEVIGHPSALNTPPYGSDLLALLPRCI